jgi:hypothetical protein
MENDAVSVASVWSIVSNYYQNYHDQLASLVQGPLRKACALATVLLRLICTNTHRVAHLMAANR